MNKEDMIYQAASEAVLNARVRIRLSTFTKDKVDDILSDAQHLAGQYAVEAFRQDGRKVKTIHQFIPKKKSG